MKTEAGGTILMSCLAIAIVSSDGTAQDAQTDPRAAIVVAIKAVVDPALPGPVLVSTPVGTADDKALAAGVAADIGGLVWDSSQTRACQHDPALLRNSKSICTIVEGQFVEIEHLKQTANHMEMIVHVRTVRGRPARRTYQVNLAHELQRWRMVEARLIEIT